MPVLISRPTAGQFDYAGRSSSITLYAGALRLARALAAYHGPDRLEKDVEVFQC